MIPDQALIEQMMLQVEAKIHKFGWDEPPQLFTVEALDPETLVMRPKPIFPSGNPADFLEYMAAAFRESSTGRALVREIARASFVGFLFVTASWGNYELTPEQWLTETRSMADIPGSIESRDVTCVDVAGRVMAMHRNRGEEPLASFGDEPVWTTLGGKVVESLLAMTIAVAEKMPAETADLEALRRVNVVTTEQAAEQYRQDKGDSHQTAP